MLKAQWCVHYQGKSSPTCKAGIRYADVTVPGDGFLLRRRPCFADGAGECTARVWPTQEELAEEKRRIDGVFANMTVARTSIVIHIKTQGMWKRNYGAVIVCPICGGNLHYTYAGAYNGHIHADCETPGCVEWME
jgi:hypothetical protein